MRIEDAVVGREVVYRGHGFDNQSGQHGEEGDRMSEFTSPPKADVMALSLLFENGRAFAAPVGTSVHDADSWRPVASLEALAEFLNVQYRIGGNPVTDVSVQAYDGRYFRRIDHQWIGWVPGEEARTETQHDMDQYYPEVQQRWAELTEVPE